MNFFLLSKHTSNPKLLTYYTHEEELLSSIASLSPPLSLNCGTLEVSDNSDQIILQIISTPEPILPDTHLLFNQHSTPLSYSKNSPLAYSSTH